ncbi:hypothetical protein DH2020_017107 [Rehmannia glutinosa]|uniref:Protein ENDOSPERM DEFECTIVE 1 n=1 Tax=Rehmannia glutinosa TaxID=99300 RepID=A0ABR0WPX4_REHGL
MLDHEGALPMEVLPCIVSHEAVSTPGGSASHVSVPNPGGMSFHRSALPLEPSHKISNPWAVFPCKQSLPRSSASHRNMSNPGDSLPMEICWTMEAWLTHGGLPTRSFQDSSISRLLRRIKVSCSVFEGAEGKIMADQTGGTIADSKGGAAGLRSPAPAQSERSQFSIHVPFNPRTQHQQRIKQHTKENGESKDHQHSHVRVSSRPDTPIAIGTERVVPSRYRQVPSSIYRSNSLNSSSNGCSAVTTAARLLQVATSDAEEQLSRISTSSSDSCSTTASNQGSSSCPNSPLCMRSSMPDVDKWLGEKKSENPSKSGLDARKGRKVSNHHEDVHSLKMLSNNYLQWRFANAKAEAALHAQKQEAEKKLCSLGGKISEIRENVKRKRNEFAVFRGIKTLTTIVDAQMPYLDDWSALEEDYLNSLSGTTHALLTSSVRLPVSAEVRADAGQLGEALISAIKVVESIGSHIQRFFQKAEEMDISISELARMVGGEKAHVEECGYLLSKTYSSQVKECSLRGTLMQLHHFNHHQPQESEATS